jgi:hypothetical protein
VSDAVAQERPAMQEIKDVLRLHPAIVPASTLPNSLLDTNFVA